MAGEAITALRVGVGHSCPAAVEVLSALGRLFAAENPHLAVEVFSIEEEPLKRDIVPWLRGGPQADVLYWFSGIRLKYLVGDGLVADLSALWAQEGWAGIFDPPAVSAVSLGTVPYALPMARYPWGLYYRRSLFDRLGLAPPSDRRAFLNACRALVGQGVTPVALAGRPGWPAAGWFDYLDLRLNGAAFHRGLMEGQRSFWDPRCRRVFRAWQYLIGLGAFSANAAELDWDEAAADFAAGRAAMMLAGGFLLSALPPGVRDDVEMVAFPALRPGVARAEDVPLDALFVPSQAANLDGACRFLAFMARPDIQAAFCGGMEMLSPRRHAPPPADRLGRASRAILDGADASAQFFDRDTVQAFSEPAMAVFTRFLAEPRALPNILRQLDEVRIEGLSRWARERSLRSELQPDGESRGLIVTLIAHKRAQEAFRNILANSPVGVRICPHDPGQRPFFNRRYLDLCGARSAEDLLAGGLARTFADPEDLDRLEAAFRRDGRVEAWEVERRRLDGHPWWSLVTWLPFRFEGVTGYIAWAYDITDRRQAEAGRRALLEQFHHAQKMEAIGVLAGGVAHDFNNVLAAILGSSALLADLVTDPMQRELAETVVAAARRGRDIAKRLLLFSREQPSERRPLCLGAVVEEGLRMLRPSINASVTLTYDCHAPDAHMLGDATELQQILANLCMNAAAAIGAGTGSIAVELGTVAIDGGCASGLAALEVPFRVAGHEGGPVRVWSGRLAAGPHLRLRVRDDGCGMDRAVAERIFEPFFTTKAVDEGTGLGLAAVHGIVAGHDGAIAVETRPGHGTVFDVFFPVCEAAHDG
ncbi:MAG TPA: extracellular solute-binding protein [Alphaproteobacteria bacterium]|nr:extracellular solute-binding protein [Alphaproteobacteria bacterium]